MTGGLVGNWREVLLFLSKIVSYRGTMVPRFENNKRAESRVFIEDLIQILVYFGGKTFFGKKEKGTLLKILLRIREGFRGMCARQRCSTCPGEHDMCCASLVCISHTRTHNTHTTQ